MPEGSSERCTPEVLRSVLWDGVLERVHKELAGARRPARSAGTSPQATLAEAVARAHSHLLVVLDPRSNDATDTVSELVSDTATLLERALAAASAPGRDSRLGSGFDDALAGRLGAHEHGVLAGELTYGVRVEEADAAAARLREVVAALASQTALSHGGLLSLRIAAVELSALLVRAAGNAAAGGGAAAAPESRSAALDRALRAIEHELASRAHAAGPPVDERGDVASHHLAAALRVQASGRTVRAIASAGSDGAPEHVLNAAREAWLVLATHEYVAVVALDGHLDVPTWERFGSVTSAIVEGAANVLSGARLASRPDAFRHRSAWRHQTVALTYAFEAYVAGLRGDAPSFERAQLMVLTRLIRAVAAIALLDLRQTASLPTNGRAKPDTQP
jgi:hypothetical protein